MTRNQRSTTADTIERDGRQRRLVPDGGTHSEERGPDTEGAEEGVVLVVEDDAPFAETVRLWLESDWSVRVANDGDGALERYDPGVDVVLLDRRMPTMSGDEVLEEIRDRDGHAGVAMMTAVSPDGDILEMNFDSYLQKPVEQDELYQTVEALFQRAQYSPEIRSLLSLRAKVETFQETYRDDELAENGHYQRLKSELDDVYEQASADLAALDDDERDVIDRLAESPRFDLNQTR